MSSFGFPIPDLNLTSSMDDHGVYSTPVTTNVAVGGSGLDTFDRFMRAVNGESPAAPSSAAGPAGLSVNTWLLLGGAAAVGVALVFVLKRRR